MCCHSGNQRGNCIELGIDVTSAKKKLKAIRKKLNDPVYLDEKAYIEAFSPQCADDMRAWYLAQDIREIIADCTAIAPPATRRALDIPTGDAHSCNYCKEGRGL